MAITIYGGNNDGDITSTSSAGVTSWEDARDATSGTVVHNAIRNAEAVKALVIGSGRGTYYSVSRAFFEFDVSDITDIPTSATIEIKGFTNGNSDMRLVKSNQSATLASGDFDEIDGWVAGGTNAGNVTYYDTAIISTWSTSGFNVITLSQQALNDIEGLTLFKCCLMEWGNDIRDTAPLAPAGAINYSGVHYADMAFILNDPRLVVTEKDNPVFFGANF